jgi:hypothetical protein
MFDVSFVPGEVQRTTKLVSAVRWEQGCSPERAYADGASVGGDP